jgi:glyoxylase-like metal-dependent hydrolase (beta-lactamase superfamily II)/rhodanese-related sulfurtransferase
MQIEQIYTGCLAQGAYYVISDGEAIIIDPLREIQPYLERLERDQVKLKYIFETHFHADFVSGHIDLAKATGATIVYGPTAMKTGFDPLIGFDGQIFKFGNATIQLLHTPGHTMESSCYLATDEEGVEKALFTGDTLFIGDVGRPDLAQHVIADLTQEKLAGHLFESLHNKILPLNDELIVYPGHGAGSACGKNMSKETSDTLGHQKKTNYALRPGLTKEQFIKEVLDGLMPPPGYFPKNVLLNISGYENINEVLHRGLHALAPKEFEVIHTSHKAVIVDTRDASDFCKGFIPGAINIGIKGSFAVWVGTLIKDINQEILLVAEEGREEEIVTRLARVGYDHAIGYLKGGMSAWTNAGFNVDIIDAVSVEEFAAIKADNPEINILDVRKESEFKSEHILGAINSPLDYIDKSMSIIDPHKTYYVHCAGGYRAMAFVSILKAKGFTNLIDVNGNFKDIKDTGEFQLTEYVCPTTML